MVSEISQNAAAEAHVGGKRNDRRQKYGPSEGRVVAVDLALEQIGERHGAALAEAKDAVEWAGGFDHLINEVAGILDLCRGKAGVVA